MIKKSVEALCGPITESALRAACPAVESQLLARAAARLYTPARFAMWMPAKAIRENAAA